MSQDALQKQIAELHEALTSTSAEAVSPETKEMLAHLEAHIEDIVSESDTQPDLSFRERLEQTLTRLETDHPRLTMHISAVINGLSNMGI